MRISDNTSRILLLALLVIALIGCHPAATTTMRPSPAIAGNANPPPKTAAAPPATDSNAHAAPQPIPIKANVSHVNATVVLVSLLDSLDYNLSIRINDAQQVGDMVTLAEPGMTIGLKPRFLLDNDGDVDTTNERNVRLLSVRSLKTGNDFHGKVSQQAPGIWMLVDVDQ
jgi:hypothetical protein